VHRLLEVAALDVRQLGAGVAPAVDADHVVEAGLRARVEPADERVRARRRRVVAHDGLQPVRGLALQHVPQLVHGALRAHGLRGGGKGLQR
jgi:hypothetical protein